MPRGALKLQVPQLGHAAHDDRDRKSIQASICSKEGQTVSLQGYFEDPLHLQAENNMRHSALRLQEKEKVPRMSTPASSVVWCLFQKNLGSARAH